jgi:hypothetical protein
MVLEHDLNFVLQSFKEQTNRTTHLKARTALKLASTGHTRIVSSLFTHTDSTWRITRHHTCQLTLLHWHKDIQMLLEQAVNWAIQRITKQQGELTPG